MENKEKICPSESSKSFEDIKKIVEYTIKNGSKYFSEMDRCTFNNMYTVGMNGCYKEKNIK